MKRLPALASLLLVVSIALLLLTCKEPGKEASVFTGEYTGGASDNANTANKKSMSIKITSGDNPVAGTYALAGTPGSVTGSILGSILNLTLKPTATGTTYTLSGNVNDTNTAITGTMTGVESGTAVKYTVNLNK